MNIPASILIYGAPGCGKSHNAEAMRRFYRCKRVLDGWAPGVSTQNGDLIIAVDRPARLPPNLKAAVFYGDAAIALGLDCPRRTPERPECACRAMARSESHSLTAPASAKPSGEIANGIA